MLSDTIMLMFLTQTQWDQCFLTDITLYGAMNVLHHPEQKDLLVESAALQSYCRGCLFVIRC